MKILIDMNLSPRWVDFLQGESIDAVHWIDIGASNAPDREIYAYASKNNYCVLTNDMDFGAILAASGDDGPSVIQFRALDLSPDALGKPLLACLQQYSESLASGALISLDPQRARIRLLPLN